MPTSQKDLRKKYPNYAILHGLACWHNYVESNPLGDILEAILLLKENSTTIKIACSPDVHALLMTHPQICRQRQEGHPLVDKISRAKNLRNEKNVFILSGQDGDYLIRPLSNLYENHVI